MSQEIEKNVSLGAETPNESSFVKRFEKFVYTLNNVAHKISYLFLFALMCITTIDVIGRNFFDNPITGAYEMTGVFLVIIIFFSLGMTHLQGDHIEIDFLTKKLPVRFSAFLNALFSFVLTMILALTTWQLYEYTLRVHTNNETTGYLGWPLYIFIIFAMIGAFLFMLTYLLNAIKSLAKVVQKK
ncbi:TRAP transporter small permease [Salirhabdus sp. Marseille-P4669]|uniref:TRAP transporter small permease n=1 Tax=Salirhabdus sp. Marseille-P4669 TaxID=2042310 RepID=UPI000C7D0736|nr:TRAP transporter small permease [Salirhabdus sp. Marseille-P4669]